MQKRVLRDTLQVSATYAGTIIGAGFASGQELLQFFISYGSYGLIGLLIAGGLFCWLGRSILELGHQLRFTSYQQTLYYVCEPTVGLFLNGLTAIFLFSVITIMLAGSGTVFQDYFHLPYAAGLALLSGVIAFTVLWGVRGIAAVNALVTPFLALSILVISANSLFYHDLDLSLLIIPSLTAYHPAPHWLLSVLLYVSYNLVLSATVLAPLGCNTHSFTARAAGGLLGGLTLTILASLVALILLLHHPAIFEHELPMLYVSGTQSYWIHNIYAFTLLTAMYTTAIACLHGCCTHLCTATGLRLPLCITFVLIASLTFSQFGFAHLIATIFPIFGYASLWFTFRLAWLSVRGIE